MRSVLVLCSVLIAANAAVLNHPFPNGYHIDVGIPLAKQVFERESAIVSGSRVFGGEPSPLGAHPYLAGVLTDVINTNSVSLSSASLISNTKVLWAAHCWNNGVDFGESSTIVLGSESIFSGGLRVITDRVELHPGWNHLTIENDIAILTIDPIPFVPNLIQPVALPIGDLQDNSFADSWGQIAGYGVTEMGLPQVQHHVNVQVITNEQCRSFFPSFIFDSTICTSGAGGVSICTGDSGGPLVVEISGQNVQIGVNSFGGSSCGSGWPSGYARVTHFLPWILQTL